MGIVFSDFGRSKLASGIAAATAAPFTMSLADGTKFKAYGAGEYEYLVLKDASLNREIIKVNARTGNAFTVVQRAIGPTTARDWAIDDLCEAALTAEGLAALLDNAILTGTTTATQVNVGGAIGGSAAGIQNVQSLPGIAFGLPAIPTAGVSIGGIAGYGYSVGTTWQLGGTLNVRATETWSSTAAGSRLAVYTTPNGTLTLQESFSFDQDGGITLPVLGARIRADFTNATPSSRLSFQSSTTNGNTAIQAIPNGSSTTASWQVVNNSADQVNTSLLNLQIEAAMARVASTIRGTGTQLPLALSIASLDTAYFGILGQWGIGGANYGTVGQAIVSGGPSAAPAWTTIPTVNNPVFTGTLTCTGDIVAFA